MTTMSTTQSVRRSVTVGAPVERAFEVFTTGFDSWWPRTHHILDGDLRTAVLEPRPGGRWYEVSDAGAECDWGEVIAFDPPHRLVLAWWLDADFVIDRSRPSTVEVTFTAVDDATTRVDLEHRDLDVHGDRASDLARGVGGDGGWGGILAGFADAVTA